jgi:gluconokinase
MNRIPQTTGAVAAGRNGKFAGDRLPCIVALDIGTSSVRAIMFDRRGRPVPDAEAQRAYQQRTTADGGVESDPDRMVSLTVAVLRDLLKSRPAVELQSLKAVACSCFWHSLLAVDGNGRPVTPLYSWADTRASRFALDLRKSVDAVAYHARTGCELHPCFWPAKLRWLREDKAIAEKTARWLGFGEYLYLRLFGVAACSVSMASGTGLYNPNSLDWDDESLTLAGVDRSALPEVTDLDKPLSGLADAYLKSLPALADIPWFPPVGDGACSNIGSGGTGDTVIAMNIGTSAAMRVTVETDRLDIVPGLFCYRVDRRRFLVGGAFATGGNMYAWLEATLRVENPTQMSRKIRAMAPDSHGLTVLPFWSGERSPGWHLGAQAAVLGMNLHTTSVDVMRASMESAGYLYDEVRKRLAERFPQAKTLVATGGALTHDPVWAQILADIFSAPITTSDVFEASSRGAAILALESLGVLKSAAAAPVRRGRVFKPVAEYHDRYMDAARRFNACYEAQVAHNDS